jgi:membrane-bound serine protease (ClpP class)
MFQRLLSSLCLLCAASGSVAVVASEPVEPSSAPTSTTDVASGEKPAGQGIYVIPIQGQIAQPTLFIVRTGVKQAIESGAQYVVLDMDTPGGALDATLEIMQILNERFKGRTATYINDEAISAGALISAATERIYFAPSGVIGAAAPVNSTGEQIEETMRQKIQSYLLAKVRSITEEHRYRSEVISAMVDVDYELKIDDEVLKEKGKLLSLTAKEATREFGDPPAPLLAAGIVESREKLFELLAGSSDYYVREFEVTWSVKLAQWITKLSPLMLSLGGLLLFIEFKTPGFGAFGAAGIVLVVIVLFGHHVAGLSGHEAMLFFVLGAALVLVELFFFPGLIVPAVAGILLMLGSLLWGMADIWPGETFELTPGVFLQPAYNLGLALVLSMVFGLLLARFLPKSLFWDRLVLAANISGRAGEDRGLGSAETAGATLASAPVVGDTAVVVSDLHPSGRIEIGGRRFEASVEVGVVRAGESVRIVRRSSFGYVVEPVQR